MFTKIEQSSSAAVQDFFYRTYFTDILTHIVLLVATNASHTIDLQMYAKFLAHIFMSATTHKTTVASGGPIPNIVLLLKSTFKRYFSAENEIEVFVTRLPAFVQNQDEEPLERITTYIHNFFIEMQVSASYKNFIENRNRA